MELIIVLFVALYVLISGRRYRKGLYSGPPIKRKKHRSSHNSDRSNSEEDWFRKNRSQKEKDSFKRWLKARTINMKDGKMPVAYLQASISCEPLDLPEELYKEWCKDEREAQRAASGIFIGPRGGMYRYNSKGHKSYDV